MVMTVEAKLYVTAIVMSFLLFLLSTVSGYIYHECITMFLCWTSTFGLSEFRHNTVFLDDEMREIIHSQTIDISFFSFIVVRFATTMRNLEYYSGFFFAR